MDRLFVLDSLEAVTVLPEPAFLRRHSCVNLGVVLQLSAFAIELVRDKPHSF